MKSMKLLLSSMLVGSLITGALAQGMGAAPKTRHSNGAKGIAVAYPWVFGKGNVTSKDAAMDAVVEVGERADYAMVSLDMAKSTWASKGMMMPANGKLPSRTSIAAFGKAVKAKKVIYGKISWHTRSIWVNAGPKTISTAKVDAYVLDVATGKVEFSKRGVEGRSDEKSNGYKIAAAVLFTPIVTAVSGGPATPQEKRAVQIALGNAFSPWINRSARR